MDRWKDIDRQIDRYVYIRIHDIYIYIYIYIKVHLSLSLSRSLGLSRSLSLSLSPSLSLLPTIDPPTFTFYFEGTDVAACWTLDNTVPTPPDWHFLAGIT